MPFTRPNSDAFGRSVLDSMAAHIAVLDASGTIIAANQAWTEFARLNASPSGISPRVGVGINYLDVCAESTRRGFAQAGDAERGIRAVMGGLKQRFHLEYPCHSPVEKRWFVLSATPFESRGGWVVVSHANITERKCIERSLELSERRWRELADAIPQIVWTAAPDGAITHLNAKATEYTGVDAEHLKGWSWDRVFHPDDLPQTVAMWTQALRTGVPRDIEARIRRADGEFHWHIIRQVPIRNADGTIAAWHGTCTDIEDLKQAQAAFRNERVVLRTLIDSIPDLIFTKDLEGRHVLCNRALVEFTGIGEEANVVGKSVFDLFPPEHARLYFADDMQVIRTGEPILDREVLARDAAGRETWRSVIKAPLRDPDGRITGLVGINRNIQHRREREQSLRDRERLLNIVTSPARVGLVVVSDRYEYRFANAAYAEIFGLEPEAIVGRRVPDLLPEGWPQIQPRLDRALAGELVEYELQLPEDRWFRVMYEPRLADDDTERTVVVSEITLQKRADTSVRESEERYRRLVNVLPAAILVHSEGRIIFCNPALVRLLGATDEKELIGRNSLDLPHSDYHAIIRERMTEMDRSGSAMPGMELRVVRLDGRTVPVYSVVTPIQDRGRTAYLVALTDLAERERASDLLRSVLGSVDDAILTLDERGIVQSANPATQRLFAFEIADVVGQNIRRLLPDCGKLGGLQNGMAGSVGSSREIESMRKDGSRFPVELTVSEFQLDGRRRFTAVVRDITARRKLESQFQQSQKMEAVGRLAGGVAHDFNNLLTVINGYCDMLLTSMPTGDERRTSLAAVSEAGERAARLTQQLLAFSRQAIIEPKLVDLNELVSESVRLLRRLIEEDITVAVIPDRKLRRIKVDPGQLEQVIMNLVVNAWDAMPKGGRLTIETRAVRLEAADLVNLHDLKPGDYARLSIADTGHGMDAETRSKIFEPFFTTKGPGKGTGLGLAVVHGAVKQSGGHIAVESAFGKGTTFTLWFPIADESLRKPKSELIRLGARGTETVLLVEDERAVRNIAKIGLESQGFTVLPAANGPEALHIATTHDGPIELLLTDVIMPELGGRELAEAVRLLRPNLRVLFMSGYTDDAVLQRGVEASRDAFIQKPFTPLSLSRKVRAVLDASV